MKYISVIHFLIIYCRYRVIIQYFQYFFLSMKVSKIVFHLVFPNFPKLNVNLKVFLESEEGYLKGNVSDSPRCSPKDVLLTLSVILSHPTHITIAPVMMMICMFLHSAHQRSWFQDFRKKLTNTGTFQLLLTLFLIWQCLGLTSYCDPSVRTFNAKDLLLSCKATRHKDYLINNPRLSTASERHLKKT